jgi:hypothetical protein
VKRELSLDELAMLAVHPDMVRKMLLELGHEQTVAVLQFLKTRLEGELSRRRH